MTEQRLHPRLLPRAATQLFEQYADAVYVHGDLTPADLTERASTATRGRVFGATGPRRVDSAELEALRGAVLEAARLHGFPEPRAGTAARAAFDADAMRAYQVRSGLFPAEAAIKPVWSFHALVLLPDVTFWRWAPQGEHGRRPNVDRYIPGRVDRHAFGRLWWRATVVTTRAEDEEESWRLLDVMGEREMDWLFARVDAFGGSPEIVRTILRIWADVLRRPPVSDGLVNRRALLSGWIRALMRRGAFVAYDLLPTDALRTALEEVLNAELERQVPRATKPPRTEPPSRASGKPARAGVAVNPDDLSSHRRFIAEAFARALPADDPVVITVTDRLTMSGGIDSPGSVAIEISDPHGTLPDVADGGDRHLLDMGFRPVNVAYVRYVDADETADVIGALLARALTDAFHIPATTTLRLD